MFEKFDDMNKLYSYETGLNFTIIVLNSSDGTTVKSMKTTAATISGFTVIIRRHLLSD